MILAIFLMLMCTASLTLNEKLNVTIYNRHPDIELTSPVYFCDDWTYNEYPIERTVASAVMKISFRLDFNKPGGILMYEVQRMENAKSDYQSSTDATSAEADEDTSKVMRLLVAWRIEIFGESRVHVILVEHNNELVLNEDKLEQLYDKVNEQFSGLYNLSKSTWLVGVNIILEATYEVVRKDLELKIAISKGVKDWNTGPALWIDPERQVSSLTVTYFY
jgi:hypothetical protein